MTHHFWGTVCELICSISIPYRVAIKVSPILLILVVFISILFGTSFGILTEVFDDVKHYAVKVPAYFILRSLKPLIRT